MDKFALVSDAKGEVMGFYRTKGLPLAAEAARYTLCDHFFHAPFGGSFLNHFWLVAARTPVAPRALDQPGCGSRGSHDGVRFFAGALD